MTDRRPLAVVIVGGGFAGVACARKLAASNIAYPLRRIASECDGSSSS